MAIVVKAGEIFHPVMSSAFANEDELQKLLADRPELLKQEHEAPLALVKREMELGDAGCLDLFLINGDGLPVAVEVKLQRNAQARREVVAQAIDYITGLTDKTVDELDEKTGGRVTEAIREFSGDDEEAFDRKWRALGANLRAGLARLIVAVDGSTPGLERILRFLAEKSELDVQLVVIERFRSDDKLEVVVARPTFTQASVSRMSLPRDNGDLLEAVQKYNDNADKDLKAVGTAANYRQIRPPQWPSGARIHYEFYQTQPYLGVELHLESDQAKPVGTVLSPLAGQALPSSAKELAWDPLWSNGRGKLTARFSRSEDSLVIATAMKELIDITLPIVSAKFAVTNSQQRN